MQAFVTCIQIYPLHRFGMHAKHVFHEPKERAIRCKEFCAYSFANSAF